MGVNKVIYYGEVLVDMSQVTVTPETLGKGATALDAKGELITGLHECEETEPKLQTKTVTPTTAQQNVTPDSGYDGLSKVTVNAMPTATQATPAITVSSAGLITAKSTQSAGYVAAGTKQATKQLTVQAAKTVTPSTSDQTAVASGRYTTGAITVKGDANLKAENIAEGVSIFGVTGTHSGGSGGGGSGSGDVETYTLKIKTDGIVYLTTIDYVEYVNGVYRYHRDKSPVANTYTFENVALKCPVYLHIYGGYSSCAEFESGIPYVLSCDYYTGYESIYLEEGFIPLESANGEIVIRLWDDD